MSKRSWMLTIIVLIFIFSASVILPGCKTGTSQNTGEKFKDRELAIQGSDTLLEVSMYWVENYSKDNPSVNISVTGGGSGTGIAALINKTVDLATASRSIKDSEIETAKNQGIDVKEFIVAWDGISVIINSNNPVTELSIEQISKIYTGEITNWGEVGGEDGEILVTSRDSSSGTFGYFKSRVVQLNGTVKENNYTQEALYLASNVSIREEVSVNENAIGYIGLGYLDDSVKAVDIIGEDASKSVKPSIENVQNGSYPISRQLFIYVSETDLTDLGEAFLEYVIGEEGQAVAREIGFVPLN
ncbi:MAG: PstS family phosphate ABC transporter substrate-binding protein [Actinobacteria bacterium]|nr:PstS family phosphate ABC transporter substrate-binding protein [Actinomycetota bacterium]